MYVFISNDPAMSAWNQMLNFPTGYEQEWTLNVGGSTWYVKLV